MILKHGPPGGQACGYAFSIVSVGNPRWVQECETEEYQVYSNFSDDMPDLSTLGSTSRWQFVFVFAAFYVLLTLE